MKNQPVVLLAAALDHQIAGMLAMRFAVAQVPSGSLALEQVSEYAPELVILQDQLPDMTGFETCVRMHYDRRLPFNVPCLILTEQQPTPEQRVAAVRSGVWDFVRYPCDTEDVSLRLDAFVQAKRNLDLALADGLVDPRTGLHTRTGLARRARQLGALMAREHGGMACVVFSIAGDAHDPRVGGLVSQSSRVSDVVGALSEREIAVLAPGTDQAGVLQLARRVAATLGRNGNGAGGVPVLRAGYDAVANLSYTPMDPVELIHRAAIAVHNGQPESALTWLRRYEARVAAHGVR